MQPFKKNKTLKFIKLKLMKFFLILFFRLFVINKLINNLNLIFKFDSSIFVSKKFNRSGTEFNETTTLKKI